MLSERAPVIQIQSANGVSSAADTPEIPQEVTPTSSILWYSRLRWELRRHAPFFNLQEPCGKHIDVALSFAPRRPYHLTSLARAALLAWSVQTLYRDVSAYPPHNLYIYMGYLTHWGHVLAILYFGTGLLIVCSSSQNTTILQQPPSGANPHRLICFLWGLFNTIAPLEILITVGYWTGVVVNGGGHPATYVEVMEHGVVGGLIFLDGFFLASIPVRIQHSVLFFVVALAYLSWTLVDAVCGIGGGDWGPAYAGDDDALYPNLKWRSETRAAAILSGFVLCWFAPFCYFGCWMLSLWSSSERGLDGARRPVVYPAALVGEFNQHDDDGQQQAFSYKNVEFV
jgi:hypothetical protein